MSARVVKRITFVGRPDQAAIIVPKSWADPHFLPGATVRLEFDGHSIVITPVEEPTP